MSKPRNLPIFAAPEDIRALLAAVESRMALAYLHAGVFETGSEPKGFPTFREIDALGHAITGDQNLEPKYLVTRSNRQMEPRVIPLKGGGTRTAFDQLKNPDSVVLSPGGLFGDGVVIAGSVATASTSRASEEILRAFADVLRERFRKIKSYHVGPGAESLLNNGARLTLSVKAPRTYDLSREDD